MRLVPDAAQPQLALAAQTPAASAHRPAAHLSHAATTLLASLERGQALDARTLREAMTRAFGGSDSEGAWVWKDAYEACETAQLLFLRRYFPGMRNRARSNAQLLGMLGKLAALTPTHTRRSEESQQLQQFSTPLELGFIAGLAACVTDADLALEPSAGTGQLAIFAEFQGASLALNEIAETRADLLSLVFPAAAVTRFNAEQIHDYLPQDVRPSVILMNPPFSAALNVKGSVAGTDLRHLRSALQRLGPGGRLVAITGANVSPGNPDYREAFDDLQSLGCVVFSAAISGALYRRHGTTIETRLTVIDRTPAASTADDFPCHPMAESAQALLDLVAAHVPARAAPDPCRAGCSGCAAPTVPSPAFSVSGRGPAPTGPQGRSGRPTTAA